MHHSSRSHLSVQKCIHKTMTYKITISIRHVLYDIDLITQKLMDINAGVKIVQDFKDSVRTDDKTPDRDMLMRIMDTRDADIRVFISRYLTQEAVTETDSSITEKNGSYTYILEMPETWPASRLNPLAKHIHEYLLYGTLYRYYGNNLPEWARTIDLDDIESSIKADLNARTGAVRRPLQPF